MAKTKEQKKKTIEDLKEKISKIKVAVFVDHAGLKVKDVQKLKKLLKEKGSESFVVKKSLASLALEESGIKNVDFGETKGGLSIIFGYEDEVAPVKVLAKFIKDSQKMEIKGGLLEKEFITSIKVLELSKLPSKQELIAKLLCQIKAPISSFVNALQGNLRGLVYVLDNYQKTIK